MTLHVPSEYPTIQAAVDMAVDGDVVLVADGTYAGEGFAAVSFQGKAITVRSQNGPERTILDLDRQGHGFSFFLAEGRNSVLDGFTVSNARDRLGGGAMVYQASPTISNCVFVAGYASASIGGIGGGIACLGGSPLLTGCTVAGNAAIDDLQHWGGGGIWISESGHAVLERCVFWGNCHGDILVNDPESSVTLECCVVDSAGLVGDGQFIFGSGNLFADPLFCSTLPCPDESSDPLDYRVDAASPCLPQNNPCGQLIGALGVGCPPTGLSAGDASSAASTLPVHLLGPWPNPTAGWLEYKLVLKRPSRVRLSVVDPGGRVLCVLSDETLGAGEYRRSQSLSGLEGPPLGSGVYGLMLRASGQAEMQRFLLIR